MPLHDWSRRHPELFHSFHQVWGVRLKVAMNFGPLPPGFTALVERTEYEFSGTRPNRIVVKRGLGRTLAVIEIVSPGNKRTRAAFDEFVSRIRDYLGRGIHVLLVDIFPPAAGDLHDAVWNQLEGATPSSSNRTGPCVASYQAGASRHAFLDLLAVGDPLPDLPLFLTADQSVTVPLEAAYLRAWDDEPEVIRTGVLTGQWPTFPADEG